MTAFEKEEKTSSRKQKSGSKSENCLIGDLRTLKRIVRKNHKNTAPKITEELNDHLGN